MAAADAAADAVCLWGRFLLKAFGPAPEGGGPEAPGGPARGGGCMAAGLKGPETYPLCSDVTERFVFSCGCGKRKENKRVTLVIYVAPNTPLFATRIL